MKAIIHAQYGSPEQLELKDVEKPITKSNEVLIKVKASSVNSWDWDLVTGKPYIYRLIFGLLKPKHPIIGIDVAGMVESVGENVTHLKVGDAVYGDISDSGFGAFAEYACTREDLLSLKPKNASFEQAAALPHGGVLALQSIHYNGTPKAKQKVLIKGAGGSTGPYAIQIAQQFNVDITCVDSSDKFDFLKSLGIEKLIDYQKQDFINSKTKYDLIVDLVVHHSIWKYKKLLNTHGACCIVGGSVLRLIQFAFVGALISKFSSYKMGLLIHAPGYKNLNQLTKMYENGKLIPHIQKSYPLEQVPEVLQQLGDKKIIGKAVIKMP